MNWFLPPRGSTSLMYQVTASAVGSWSFEGDLEAFDIPTGDPAEPVGGASMLTVGAGTQASNSVGDVTVDHTPGGTNENARITVNFDSPTALEANLDTITIEFEDDVQVPALLDERFIIRCRYSRR